MANNVYSLVLSGEVVAAVDVLAAQQGCSRSALVNQVLAEYASVSSPQQRQRQTLAALQNAAFAAGMRASSVSGGSITLRTALRYKYNPALNYTIEVRDGDEYLGRLRVHVRSQNEGLLTYFQHFFDLWWSLEQKHLDNPPQRTECRVDEKRYTRTLRRPAVQVEEAQTGEMIADYITLLDGCLKAFFGNLDDARNAVAETERAYLTHLAGAGPTAEL